jgi:ABC-type sulfate/molybdate transport systems ATPase subunit
MRLPESPRDCRRLHSLSGWSHGTIRRLRFTTILVTHDREDAGELATRVVPMRNRLVTEGGGLPSG